MENEEIYYLFGIIYKLSVHQTIARRKGKKTDSFHLNDRLQFLSIYWFIDWFIDPRGKFEPAASDLQTLLVFFQHPACVITPVNLVESVVFCFCNCKVK